jgi:hypothetical protein
MPERKKGVLDEALRIKDVEMKALLKLLPTRSLVGKDSYEWFAPDQRSSCAHGKSEDLLVHSQAFFLHGTRLPFSLYTSVAFLASNFLV